MKRQVYEYWLNSIPGIGWKSIDRLLKAFQTPEAVYHAEEKALEKLLTHAQLDALNTLKRKWDLVEEYEKLSRKEISFLTITSPAYPRRLREIPDPPYGLFYRGKLPEDEMLAVAVVGARECSEYGKYVAQELGKTFARRGVQVISGMARGIDGITQKAAVEDGGSSFAVLGCGVDICYPSQNRPLYETLLKRGGILSAYPPGTSPQASLFPPRNRIVSGLADALIVVEARQKSGTLITVDMALEQGREVYVVPGRLTDRLSDGCNRLIKQGAGIVLSPESFMEEMEHFFPEKKCLTPPEEDACEAAGGEGTAGLEEQDMRILSCLDFYPRSVEQIREAMGKPLDYSQTLKRLMKLCLLGKATQVSAGYYQRTGM